EHLAIHMPFAGMIRSIAERMQHLRQQSRPGRSLAARPAAFSRKFVPPDLLRVITSQNRCPRGPTAGGVIELCEAQAIFGQLIEIRRLNLAAVTADVCKAEIIGQNDQDVWLWSRCR